MPDSARADTLAVTSAAPDSGRVDSVAAAPAAPDSAHADPSLVPPMRPAADVPAPVPPAAAPVASGHSRSLTPWGDLPRRTRTYLPFPNAATPPRYPNVSIGIGFGYFSSELRGVDAVFTAVEDSIRRSGFYVPGHTPSRSGGATLWTLGVNLSPELAASLQIGETNEPDDQVRFGGGVAHYRWTPPGSPKLSLGAGIGAGVYRVSFRRAYGVVISAVDANGGWVTLDYVSVEGGGSYTSVLGDVALELTPRLVIQGGVQQLFMGDVTGDAGSLGRHSINASGSVWSLGFELGF